MWSLGVILFAILCGRLPFEGPDLIGTKRPREQIIKSRIMKCQYKIDESLGPEAKDLVRRMLQVDPSERASIPEIFNHVWVRPAVNGNLSDAYHMQSLAAAPSATTTGTRTNPEAASVFSAGTPSTSHRYSAGAKLEKPDVEMLSPRERADSNGVKVSLQHITLRHLFTRL